MRFKTAKTRTFKVLARSRSLQIKKKKRKKIRKIKKMKMKRLTVTDMGGPNEAIRTTVPIKTSTTFNLLSCFILLLLCNVPQMSSMMMTTNCLSQTPACSCSWKNGKFIADCSNQNLNQVPKVSYLEAKRLGPIVILCLFTNSNILLPLLNDTE